MNVYFANGKLQQNYKRVHVQQLGKKSEFTYLDLHTNIRLKIMKK